MEDYEVQVYVNGYPTYRQDAARELLNFRSITRKSKGFRIVKSTAVQWVSQGTRYALHHISCDPMNIASVEVAR